MDSKYYIRSWFFKIILSASFFSSCIINSESHEQKNICDSTYIDEFSIDSICTLDNEFLMSLLGSPLSCDTFLLNSGVSEFRIELYNIFSPQYLEINDIYIVEKTWQVDNINNFTVWYNWTNNILMPVDSCLWQNDLEF